MNRRHIRPRPGTREPRPAPARPPKPSQPPGFRDTCDSGYCHEPADGWIFDDNYWIWVPACSRHIAEEPS